MNEGSSWPGSVPPALVLTTSPAACHLRRVLTAMAAEAPPTVRASHGTVSSSPSSRPPRRSQRLSRITAGPGLRGWGPPSQSQPRHARLPTSVPFPCRGLKESCNPKTVQEPLMPFKKSKTSARHPRSHLRDSSHNHGKGGKHARAAAEQKWP